MLENLEIVNGLLSPEFDIYNNIYSVDVASDVSSLVINYEVSDGYTVNIIDNHDLDYGENEVYIQVIKESEINTYTLLVYKENVEKVINYENLVDTVEVQSEMNPYTPYIIIGSCLIIILVVFYFLFLKGKKRYKK